MIELRLIHDGLNWVAEDKNMSAKAQTLVNLDIEVARLLKQSRNLVNGSEVKVKMTFDRSVIPEWIRQYSGHYFNRVVTLDIK